MKNYNDNNYQASFSSKEDFVLTKFDNGSDANTELVNASSLLDKCALYQNIKLTNNPQMNFVKFGFDSSTIYFNNSIFNMSEENRRAIYYFTPIKPKGFLNRLFGGDYFSARMATFQNTEIPFLLRGSGVATEVSTKSTNLSASYFKSNTQNLSNNTVLDVYQKGNKSLTSDTKLAFAIPYFPELKLFGGYSYNRNIESRLTKGPSFGFQAAVFEYLKVDTTFVRQQEGKTSAKVLFSINMPIERFKF